MLTEITDYVARARARVLQQYREKTVLMALVGELALAVQAIETSLFDVIEQTTIGTSTGAWLDRLGALIGEERGGEGDIAYRRYILARVQANTSEGTFEDLIAVITAWYGSVYPTLIITEPGRANVLIDLDSSDITQEQVDRLAKLLRDTRAAGVGAQFLYQLQGSSKIFQFSSDATLQADSNKGFGDSSNPATGGAFRGVAQV